VRVWLKTTGRATPTKDSRVRFCGLIYIVTAAESPTELDDVTAVTECAVQPADAGGKTVINAELIVARRDHVKVR